MKTIVKTTKACVQTDSLTFVKGKIFSSELAHSYIRYTTDSGTYIQVYSQHDNYNLPILNYQIGTLNYMGDSIFDINGDQVKDLAIHWYPSSGCCLADAFDCFIYNNSQDSFFPKTEILNPTFFPEKGVTFSMDYNQPGLTKFYRLKWVDNSIDTLKSYSWKDQKQKIVIVKDLKNGRQTESHEVLDQLNMLYGFDWFMMKPKND